MTTTESAQAHDEAQLRQLIADQMSAICAKDLDRLMNYYAADVVVFDVKPQVSFGRLAANERSRCRFSSARRGSRGPSPAVVLGPRAVSGLPL